MLDPRSFSLARSLSDEHVRDNRHYVIESWWTAAPPSKWRQRFHQIRSSLHKVLLLLTRRERRSVNGQWQETSA